MAGIHGVKGQGSVKMAGLVDLLMPVGFIYISTVNTNPGTYLGGTWSAFGVGKVLVGVDTGDVDFNTPEKTGGAKTVSVPAHTHSVPYTGWPGDQTGQGAGWLASNTDGGGGTLKHPTGDATSGSGGGSSPSVVQPYIAVYYWKRTV